MSNYILEKLKKNIDLTNINKSSHWKKYLDKNTNILDKHKFLGFGYYTKKNLKSFLRIFINRIFFGNSVFRTKTFRKYKFLYDKENRSVDNDTIRHIFIFETLKKLLNPQKICIIGDGKLNAVLGAHLTFPQAKIFNVNLSEVLINDYLILKDTKIKLNKSIKLVEDINQKESDKILHLVPSNFKNFLLGKEIDLFINVCSFQEMNMEEINNYFNIISSNKSKLYCCNREYKKLIGREEIRFDEYPWNNSRKIFWEYCPWHQKYYNLKYPFIHNFDGKHIHCFVEF